MGSAENSQNTVQCGTWRTTTALPELEVRRTRAALAELRSFGLVGHQGWGRGSRWFLV